MELPSSFQPSYEPDEEQSRRFIITGQWAKKAYQEAARYGKANILASSEDKTYTYIPDCSDLPVSEDADYVYVCYNNYNLWNKISADSKHKRKDPCCRYVSCILSEPVNVEDLELFILEYRKMLDQLEL